MFVQVTDQTLDEEIKRTSRYVYPDMSKQYSAGLY